MGLFDIAEMGWTRVGMGARVAFQRADYREIKENAHSIWAKTG